MASRLSTIILAISSLALALLVTNTFAHRTTVTTVEIEDDNRQQSQQQCQQEIQKQDLNHCEQYVMEQSRSRGGRSGGSNVLAMITDDSDNKKSEHLKPCCQELEQLNEQCQCQALAQIVQEHMQQGDLQGEKLQKVAQKLQNLPQRCQVGSQRCQIHGSIRWF